MTLLQDVEASQLRKDLPKFNVGDTVRVFSRIKEGEKERVQYFEGIVIGFHRNGIATTFKVRKESYGVGVERTYPIHSPLIEKIEVKKRGDVRRAKLFYLRGVSGKKARIREKKDWLSKKGVVVPSEGVVESLIEEVAAGEVAVEEVVAEEVATEEVAAEVAAEEIVTEEVAVEESQVEEPQAEESQAEESKE